MVGIFTGLGAGFERGSGASLGGVGLLGGAGLGRNNEGVFVNAATGNLLVTQRDEFLVGRGPDAEIARTYNSFGALDENGDHWRQSTDRRVFALTGTVNTAGSTVKRVSADGSEITYSWTGSYYQTTDGSGAHDRLTYADNVWTWRDGDSQWTETYGEVASGAWYITGQSDTSGNTLSFSYNEDQQLSRVTTADGGYIQYSWSGSNISVMVTGYTDLATSTSQTLTRTRYGYDGQGRLNTVTVDLSPEDNSIETGLSYTTTYTYHGTSNRIATISQTDGSSLAIAYDGSGRVTSLTQTVASGDTRETGFEYLAGETRVTDPRGQVTRLFYDSQNQLIGVEAPVPQTGGTASTVAFSYDAAGNLASMTDASGAVTQYRYDAQGNVTYVRHPNGSTTLRVYDLANKLIQEIQTGAAITLPAGMTVSAAHVTAGLGDSTAVHTRHVYDAAGRLRYSVSGAGNVTEFRYNAAGQLVREVRYPAQAYSASAVATLAQMDAWRDGLADRSGVQIVEYEYDARGGLAQTVSWGAANTNGTASTANGYARTYYAYDQAGNLVSRRTEPDGYGETFVYDGLGRMTGSTDLNGGTTSILFTDAATTTMITTGTGHVVTSVYNKAGELISQTDSGSDAASAAQVSYLYDRNGQVRRTAVRTGRTSDGDRIDYTYHLYDKSGRKIADINHIGEVAEYRYDAAGRVVATVRYTNRLTSAQIASLANPDSEIELASIRPGNHSYDLWQWTTYNASGQVATTVLGDGSVTRYTYDQAGRLIATYGYQNKIAVSGYMNGTSPGPAAATLPAAHAGDTVTRTFYDADGRVRGVLNAEGHLSRIVYDSAGQKVEETVYAGATTAGLRASGTYQQLWDSVSKDAAKDITSRYVYDGQGLLRFTIDALGRVTERVYAGAVPGAANGAVRAVVQFAGTLGALGSYDFAAVNTAVNALRADTNNRGVFNVYNDRGQVAYTIDSAGTVTGFTYDAGGRVTKTVQYAELRSTASLPTQATMDTWAAANAANARVTRTWYSARGEVVATVDAEGYVTRNWYDAQGRLWDSRRYATAVTATDAWTLSHIDGASLGTSALTRYRYDQSGNLENIYDPNGTRSFFGRYANGLQAWENIAHEQGSDEARVMIIYDQAGRVREKRYFTADTYVDGDSAHVRELYTYDGLGNVATVTDANNTVTAYTYDRLGRVLTETRASGTAEAVTTAYEYDAFGQVVRVTDARGHSSYSYYDQAGRTVRTVDAENYLTVTQYTAFGEVHSVTRHYTRISGTPAVGTLPAQPAAHDLDATTSFLYDRLGRVLQATDATQINYEAYTYDAFGNLETHRNKLGGVTSYQYDRLGRRTYETQYVRDVATNALIATIVTRLDYDSRGNITTRTEAYGSADARITNYEYNAVNQLISSYTPNLSYYADGNAAAATVANTSPGSVTVAEVYSYDRRGNLIEKTDANGVRTQTWYDKLGRVTHQLVQQNATQGTLTQNTYDANGNLTESRVYETLVTMQANATGIAPAGSGNYRVTTFIYDRLNRMTSSTVPNIKYGQYATAFAMSTGSLTTSYLYDAMGNVIRVTDPNGGQVHSYYDKLGRKEREVDQGRYLTYWTYNAQGNVETERRYAQPVTGTVSTASYGTVVPNDPSADAATALAQSYQDRITAYTYDRMGRKLTETRQGVLVFNGTTGFAVQDAVVSFTYNALGQVATKTEAVDAGGAATNAYTYDSAGRLTTEARKAFTDFNNATVTPTVAYAYNLRNDLITQTESGTVGADTRTTVYTYASGGRLESVTDAEGFVRTYRYDRGGNIVREEYTRVLGTGGEAQEGIVYAYDAQGRVVTQYIAERGNGTYAAAANDIRNQTTYNAFGDVASRGVNGVYAEHFRYDNAGRLEATSAGDGIWKYFLYDRNGNQTLAITSTGANIQVLGRDTVLDMFGSEAGIATNHVAGVTATITVYDARGLAITVLEPQRELAAGAARVTLTTSRSYNAFGDIVSETNAREHTVDYTHNTMGRLIRTESPQVNVTGENGVTSAQRPTEYCYYDRSGRMVASRDANGNLTRQTLLNGTGFGGTEALITQVIYADTGVVNTAYDIHGNARSVQDQINRWTCQSFDRMGRMTQLTHAGGLVETFAYDGLGQQIRRFNSHYGSGVAETTLYDRQGRIQTHIAMGGDTTVYAYAWDGSISIAGFAASGGWQKTTTYANSRTSIEREDVFARMVQRTDLGGNTFNFTYDAAARLTSSSDGKTYTWLNTGKVAASAKVGSNPNSPYYGGTLSYNLVTTYGYDRAGNLVLEELRDGTIILSSQSAEYDALGRMVSWSSSSSGTAMNHATSVFSYDANGNIRNRNLSYTRINPNGSAGSPLYYNYWYRFDSMNRVVTSDGAFDTTINQIVRGYRGTDIVYDAAGQRVYTLRNKTITTGGGTGGGPGDGGGNAHDQIRDGEGTPGGGPSGPTTENYILREDYTYTLAGALETVRIAEGSHVATGYGSTPSAPGTLRAFFGYDALGRQTLQRDYDTDGVTKVFERTVLFNAKGQAEQDSTLTRRGSVVYRSETTHNYGSGTSYALGAQVYSVTQNWQGTSAQPTSRTDYNYIWFDAAQLGHMSYDENTANGSNTIYHSYYGYHNDGAHSWAYVWDGAPRLNQYTVNTAGQIIRREERKIVSGTIQTTGYNAAFYLFGGKQMGEIGVNASGLDYQGSIILRTTDDPINIITREPYRRTDSNFSQSADIITSYGQGSSSGTYTVRSGETLSSIASNVWGDSSLWYKLAQTNGLSGDSGLVEGQSLRIPVGVVRNTHNASTLKPYDPSEAVGDTSPTTPKPPKNKKCGAFGQVLLVVIAVAVSLATVNPFTGGGILSGMASAGGVSGFAAGSIAGAAGSIASQAVGVATGIQEKFSWTGVAQAALGGGIGTQNLGISGSGFGASLARGALGNVLSQAASTVLGPQKKFSWSGVAAAGIGAGVGAWATRQIGGFFDGLGQTAGDIAAKTTAGTAAAIVSAATRTAFGDGNFGDNVRRAIPDVIGQALGSAIGNRAGSVVASVFGLNGSVEAGAEFAGSTTVTYRSDGSVQGDGTSVLGTVVVSAKKDDVSFRSLWGYMDYLTSRNLGDMYGQVEAGSASRLSDNLNALAVRAANLNASSFGLGYRLNGLIGEQNILTGLRNQQVEARSNRDQVIAEAQADRAARLSFFLSERVISAQIGQGAASYEASTARSLAEMGFTSTSFEATSALVADARAWLDSSRGARAELTAAIHDGQRWIVDGLSVAAGPVGAVAGVVSLGSAAMRGELTVLDALNFVPAGRLGIGKIFGNACFVAGTLVMTEHGARAIEDIRVGDRVWSASEFDSGQPAWRRVINTVSFEDKAIWAVSIRAADGRTETIRATGNHPFWVEVTNGDEATGGWTAVELLKSRDQLRLADGSPALVEVVICTDITTQVFNFEVEGYHTYHVGTLGVWVHNDDCGTLVDTLYGKLPIGQVRAAARRNFEAAYGTFTLKPGEHLHHVSELLGRALPYQKRVADQALRIQHSILAKHGLDWATDPRFLVIAKNGSGVHSLRAKTDLARDLFAVRNDGLKAVLDVMKRHADIAAIK